jgi:acetoacetyl-CoA synthetase
MTRVIGTMATSQYCVQVVHRADDSVQITPSRSGNGGGVVMLGRSDGVLNPGGIRFGPTDIYSVLENDEYSKMGIEETLVVGLMVEGGSDEKVILFVKVCLGLFFAI